MNDCPTLIKPLFFRKFLFAYFASKMFVFQITEFPHVFGPKNVLRSTKTFSFFLVFLLFLLLVCWQIENVSPFNDFFSLSNCTRSMDCLYLYFLLRKYRIKFGSFLDLSVLFTFQRLKFSLLV